MKRRRGPWVLLGVTICALLAVTGLVVATTIDPALMGARGTATITWCATHRGRTSCYGTFRTDDGSVNVKDEQIQGEDGAAPGDRFTAYYRAFNHSVGTVDSPEDIVYASIAIALLLAATAYQLWNLIIRPRRAAVAADRRHNG